MVTGETWTEVVVVTRSSQKTGTKMAQHGKEVTSAPLVPRVIATLVPLLTTIATVCLGDTLEYPNGAITTSRRMEGWKREPVVPLVC